MAGDAFDRETLAELSQQIGQHLVLHSLEGQRIAAFQFDTDGEIVATLTPAPGRHPGMPGAQLGIDELDQFAGAADEEMRGNPQVMDARVVGMLLRVEGVGEKLGDAGTTEAVWGEADGVDDDDANIGAVGALIAIG